MKTIKYNNKGVTLIELLIVLAIMGIVFQVIYSIFFIGNKSFNTSKNKGFAQQDVRIASTYIINEIRTAKEISTDPIDILEGKYYAFTLKNGKLCKETFNNDDSSEQILSLSSNLSKLEFNYIEGNRQGIINIIVAAEEGQKGKDEQIYEVNFDVLLENIPNYNKEINQNIIYYLKYE